MGFDDHLTQSLTRRRNALSPDGKGGHTAAPTDVVFDGLIVQRSSSESLTGGRDTALGDFRLYYQTALDIVSSDVIIDAAGNQYDAGVPNNVHELDCVGQCDLRLKRDKA